MAVKNELGILQTGRDTARSRSSTLYVAYQGTSAPNSGQDTETKSHLRHRAEAGQRSSSKTVGSRFSTAQATCRIPHTPKSVLTKAFPPLLHECTPKRCGRCWVLLGPRRPICAIILLTASFLMEANAESVFFQSSVGSGALTGEAVRTQSTAQTAEYMKRFDIPANNIDLVWVKSGGYAVTRGSKTYRFEERGTNVGVYAGYSSMYDSSSRRYCERSSAKIDTQETVGRRLMAAGACPNWGKVIAFTDSRGGNLNTERWKTEIHGNTMPHTTTGCKEHAPPGSSEVRKEDEGMAMYSGYMTSCPFNRNVYEEDMRPDGEYDTDICYFVTFANKLWFLDTTAPSGGRPFTPYAFHGNGGHRGYDYEGQTKHTGCPPYSPPRTTSAMKNRSWLTDPFECSVLSRCTSNCWPFADGRRCFRSLPAIFDLNTKECRLLGYHTQFFQKHNCAGNPISAGDRYYCLKPTKTAQTSSLVYISAHVRPDYETKCPPREPFLKVQWGEISGSRYCNPLREEKTIENTTAEGCGQAVFENSSSDDDSLNLGGMHWATFTSDECTSMAAYCRATARGRCALYTKVPNCFFEKPGSISFTSLTAVDPGLAREPPKVAILPSDPCAKVECGEHGSCSEGKCVCKEGWMGASCEKRDLCYNVVCQNGGHCDATNGKCICKEGWGGASCEKRDLCHNVVCQNGGHCDATNGKCICKEGWLGAHCEKRNLCYNVVCQNGGHCDAANGKCVCKEGWGGANCEKRDLCHNVVCQNGGHCDATSGKCVCKEGWGGANCDTRDLCQNVVCQNGGHCDATSGKCVCKEGWGGANCDERDLCHGIVCRNGGHCDATNGKCVCTTCYEGSTCDVKKPKCCIQQENCGPNEKCDIASNRCKCTQCYEGPTCTDRTKNCCLADAECGTNARCDTSVNKCVCLPEHAGEDCDTVVPVCDKDSCSGQGQCDPSTGRCTCNTCYTGKRCENAIPYCCITDDDCPSLRTRCSDINNRCVCSPGYTGKDCEILGDRVCREWCTSKHIKDDASDCEDLDCIYLCCQSYHQCAPEKDKDGCYEERMKDEGADCCLPERETSTLVFVAAAAGGVGLLLLIAGGAILVVTRKKTRRPSAEEPSVVFDTSTGREDEGQSEEAIEVSLEDFQSHPDDKVNLGKNIISTTWDS